MNINTADILSRPQSKWDGCAVCLLPLNPGDTHPALRRFVCCESCKRRMHAACHEKHGCPCPDCTDARALYLDNSLLHVMRADARQRRIIRQRFEDFHAPGGGRLAGFGSAPVTLSLVGAIMLAFAFSWQTTVTLLVLAPCLLELHRLLLAPDLQMRQYLGELARDWKAFVEGVVAKNGKAVPLLILVVLLLVFAFHLMAGVLGAAALMVTYHVRDWRNSRMRRRLAPLAQTAGEMAAWVRLDRTGDHVPLLLGAAATIPPFCLLTHLVVTPLFEAEIIKMCLLLVAPMAAAVGVLAISDAVVRPELSNQERISSRVMMLAQFVYVAGMLAFLVSFSRNVAGLAVPASLILGSSVTAVLVGLLPGLRVVTAGDNDEVLCNRHAALSACSFAALLGFLWFVQYGYRWAVLFPLFYAVIGGLWFLPAWSLSQLVQQAEPSARPAPKWAVTHVALMSSMLVFSFCASYGSLAGGILGMAAVTGILMNLFRKEAEV